jgi:hypothetical protein
MLIGYRNDTTTRGTLLAIVQSKGHEKHIKDYNLGGGDVVLARLYMDLGCLINKKAPAGMC